LPEGLLDVYLNDDEDMDDEAALGLE